MEKEIITEQSKSEQTKDLTETLPTETEINNSETEIVKDVNVKDEKPVEPTQETSIIAKGKPVKETTAVETIDKIVPVTETTVATPTVVEDAVDFNKEFVLSIKSEFLGGIIKISVNGTRIQRIDNLKYKIFGKTTTGLVLFEEMFVSVDINEADVLWKELCEYEKNPSRFINDPYNPLAVQQAQELQKSTEPAKDKFMHLEGVPITKVNIDEFIKSIPETSPMVNGSQANTLPTPPSQMTMPPVIDYAALSAQYLTDIATFGETIEQHINSSWQAASWGYLPLSEAETLIKNSVAKNYTYILRQDSKGYYLELTRETTTVRIPKDVNSYLKIK